MSYNVSFSSNMHSSAFSTSWWKLRIAMCGSTTASDTLGDSMNESVSVMRDAIGVLPADLRHQKRSHTGVSSATKRVAQLETLEAIAALRLPHHIQHRVDELCTLRVVSLHPIVARASLSEHKVVWPEQPSGRSRTDAVHGSGSNFMRIARSDHRWHALQLEVRVTVLRAHVVDAVLVRDGVPGLGLDLTALDMDELTHGTQAKDNKERNRPRYSEVSGSSS